MKIIWLILVLFLLSCNLKKEKKNDVLLQYLNDVAFSNKCPFVISNAPTFYELKEKNVFSNCISCHSDANPIASLSLQNYEQTKSRAIPYNPDSSILYLSVLPNGKMGKYSNVCINDAIYKWIQNGAKE